ncbi:MAG: hypothetical protein ACRC9L_06535 [Brevinema sp.]
MKKHAFIYSILFLFASCTESAKFSAIDKDALDRGSSLGDSGELTIVTNYITNIVTNNITNTVSIPANQVIPPGDATVANGVVVSSGSFLSIPSDITSFIANLENTGTYTIYYGSEEITSLTVQNGVVTQQTPYTFTNLGSSHTRVRPFADNRWVINRRPKYAVASSFLEFEAFFGKSSFYLSEARLGSYLFKEINPSSNRLGALSIFMIINNYSDKLDFRGILVSSFSDFFDHELSYDAQERMHTPYYIMGQSGGKYIHAILFNRG